MPRDGTQIEDDAHLIHFRRITVQTEPNSSNVGDDSFATIPTSFLLAKNEGHFVAILGIIHLLKIEGGGKSCIALNGLETARKMRTVISS